MDYKNKQIAHARTTGIRKGNFFGAHKGVLRMLEAFEIKHASGKTSSVYFKINDDQFIEVTPALKPGELIRQARVVFHSWDLEQLHSLYARRGFHRKPAFQNRRHR